MIYPPGCQRASGRASPDSYIDTRRFTVHHEFWPETDSGSVWVTMTDPRGLSGFIVDVEALELDRTKITVYPGSGFFARRSREWIARTLKFQKTPAM